MWEQIVNVMRAAALRVIENAAEMLPGLAGLVFVFAAACVLAVVVRVLVLRALQGLHIDARAEHLGLGAPADWAVVGGLSLFIARTVMWVIVVAGLLAGLTAVDAELPYSFSRSLLGYIPNLLAALLILVVGVVLARFVARSVLIGAVNLRLGAARPLSGGVKWLLMLLAWTLALEHLGIGRGILAATFAILFGGIVLASALAVGLGAKDLVRRALERQAAEPDETPDELTHV